MQKRDSAKYGTIVAKREIRFDGPTWRWAKEQKNLSKAIRNLIRTQVDPVKRGRPLKKITT